MREELNNRHTLRQWCIRPGKSEGGQKVFRHEIKKYNIKPAERGDFMTENTFMSVDEVANELGVSKSYAYKIVQRLNNELKEKGFITISGRLNKQYFMERVCYGAKQKERD